MNDKSTITFLKLFCPYCYLQVSKKYLERVENHCFCESGDYDSQNVYMCNHCKETICDYCLNCSTPELNYMNAYHKMVSDYENKLNKVDIETDKTDFYKKRITDLLMDVKELEIRNNNLQKWVRFLETEEFKITKEALIEHINSLKY